MSYESLLVQWLGQKVRGLVIGFDRMNADLLTLHIVPKMMKPNIQMLRSRPVFVNARHLQGSAVVFEDMAMDSGLRSIDWKAATFHLLQKLHDWDRIT